jgi:O-antigen/teichoic acid export membrane protein
MHYLAGWVEGLKMFLHHSQTISARHGVTRPGIWRLGIAACSLVMGASASILIARALGPGAFGIYMFTLWLATIATPAVGAGMSAVTRLRLAEIQSREEPRLVAGVFYFVWQRQYRRILLYCLLYLLLAFPLSAFFGANAPILLLLLAGLCALPLLLSGIASITLRSLRRFDLLAAIHLFGAALTLFLLIVAVQLQGDQVGIFLFILAAAGTLTLAMAVLCLMRLLPARQEPGALLQGRLTRGLSNSLPLFILDVVVWQRSEMLLLARGHSSAELGFYALSSVISAHVMDIAPTLLSTCLLPLLLRYAPGQRYSGASDAFVKTSRYVALLAIPICAGIILCCPLIIVSCFGDAYLPVVTPLRILLISAAFGSVSTISLTHLANGERKRAQLRLGTATASLNIVLALPLIALWGVTGAALASAAAQIVSAGGSILICKRLILG